MSTRSQEARMIRLEQQASPPSLLSVFILDEHEPLPVGVDAERADVMVIRLVGGDGA